MRALRLFARNQFSSLECLPGFGGWAKKTSVEGIASTPQLSTGVVAVSSDSFTMISKTVDTEVNYK